MAPRPKAVQNVIVNVHKNILCATSAFFRRATKKEWSESRADPDTIDLADDNLDVVKAYAHWLYYRQLPTPGDDIGKTHEFLGCAYVFGEKIMDTTFKNTVIDAIVAAVVESRICPGADPINTIYKGTTTGSPARRLLADVHIYIAHAQSDDWKNILRYSPRELLVDVVVGMIAKRPSLPERPWKGASYKYHEEKEV